VNDREKLIEEAAKAIAEFTNPDDWTAFRDEAGAALAVFEKALGEATVTPTDDERCTYCGQEFPSPISIHHSKDECVPERCSACGKEGCELISLESDILPEPSADVIEEARAKAALRFPAADDTDAALARAGFIEGYLAHAEPQGEPSDAAVDAAAQAMFEPDGPGGEYTWAEMVVEDPSRADIWREDARKVLRAVAATEQGENHG